MSDQKAEEPKQAGGTVGFEQVKGQAVVPESQPQNLHDKMRTHQQKSTEKQP